MKKIIEKLTSANSIALFTHCNADLDAYGSVSALYHYLKNQGKQVCVFLCEKINSKFDFLGLENIFYEPQGKFDLAVCVDCSSIDRIEKFGNFYKSFDNILIDHHAKSAKFYDYCYIDSNSPATCDIIFDLFNLCNIKITPIIATSLYMGYMGDTGCLLHDNTTSQTFKKIAKLIELDCDRLTVKEQILKSKSLEEVRLYEKLIKTLEINSTIASGYLTIKDKKELKIEENVEVGDILNLFLEINCVKVAVLFKQSTKNIYRVSLRSKKGYDISSIAIKYGGGGHKQAAGFTVVGKLQHIKRKIVGELEELYGRN